MKRRHLNTALGVLGILLAITMATATSAGPSEHQAAVDVAGAVEELQSIPAIVEKSLRAMWAAPEGSQDRQRLAVEVCRIAKRSPRALPFWTPEGDLICRIPAAARKVVL